MSTLLWPKLRWQALRLCLGCACGQCAPEAHPSWCAQAPLAKEQELAGAHCSAYVRRALGGRLTDREQRAIGLPWSPSLATYARQVMVLSSLWVLLDLISTSD